MASQPAARRPDLRVNTQIMSSSEIERTPVRLVRQIIERHDGPRNLGLIGIRKRAVPLAERLARAIELIERTALNVGTLDTAPYRDDLSPIGPKPIMQKAEIGFSVSGKNIILVDDVLYTGRTTGQQ
jgi:pyrimidine operon attenuation protein / uracil phosphoribosyltransferase